MSKPLIEIDGAWIDADLVEMVALRKENGRPFISLTETASAYTCPSMEIEEVVHKINQARSEG